METYRLEAVTRMGEKFNFEFQCDNEGLHMTAVGMLQEMFEAGKMQRLFMRGEFKSVMGKNAKVMEGRPWRQVGSFDLDNLFVPKG